MTSPSSRILALLCLAAGVLAASTSPRAPASRPADAPLREFSAERAMVHLRQIAARPRPTGSPELERVRHYLVTELERSGFSVERRADTSLAELDAPGIDRYRVAARVHNLVAHRPGTASTGVIALMAHYDSVPASPGASDNGAAVAALLETARALSSAGPLRNDVLILLTDGEELGMLGARALFSTPPWASPPAAVLNFEARGHRGPVLMFESTPGSGALVRQLAGIPGARASSLFDEVYRLLPNGTDFKHVKERGIAGLNFAYIEGITHYHNALDSLDHIDPASVQHHGEYALGLVRRLGDAELTAPAAHDVTFFNVGDALVMYPTALALPFAALAVTLLLVVIARGLASGSLRWRRVLLGAAAALGQTIAAAIVVTAAAMWITSGRLEARRLGDVYQHGGAFAAVLLGVLALVLGVAAGFRGGKATTAAERASGAALWWAVLALTTSALIPGAAFVVTWPLVGVTLALLAPRLAMPLTTAPLCLVVLPLLPLLFEGLTLSMAAAPAVVLALSLGLTPWQLDALLPERRRWLVAAGVAAAAIACAAMAARPADETTDTPRLSSLLYVMDADSGRALWVSSDEAPDRWTARFLTTTPRFGPLPSFAPPWTRSFWSGTAPPIAVGPPQVEVVSDHVAGGERRLRLAVRSVRGARALGIILDGAFVRWYRVDGRDQPAEARPGRPFTLWLEGGGTPPWQIELGVDASTAAPIQLRAFDRSDELPAELVAMVGPRPPGLMPATSLDVEAWSHTTFVSRTVALAITPPPPP